MLIEFQISILIASEVLSECNLHLAPLAIPIQQSIIKKPAQVYPERVL